MHPVEFEEQNVVFAKDQPEYLPLPALQAADGRVISCWGLTWRERLRVLLGGRLWLETLTFHSPLQPQRPAVQKPFRLNDKGELEIV